MFDIAQQLKTCRERKGYSQVHVFEETGIHNKTLSGYERGISTPDIETLRTLLIFYETSADDFFMMPKFEKEKSFQSNKTDNILSNQANLLRTYLQLDERDQHTLLTMAETMLKTNYSDEKTQEHLKPKKGASAS